MQLTDIDIKEDLMKRLRRVEGQVRGVEKMLDENRDCREVLQQLTAIKSAVQQVSMGRSPITVRGNWWPICWSTCGDADMASANWSPAWSRR